MPTQTNALYGLPPREVIDVPADCVQCSPRVPGSQPLSELADECCTEITVHAPASTLERRAVLAHALRVLADGGRLTALAAKNKGGARIAEELESFGCRIEARHRRRHQIVETVREGAALTGIAEAIATGGPQFVEEIGLWSQPGLFSWDRIDPGSRLLLKHLPPLSGRGGDFGCGIGILSRAVREATPNVTLTLVDVDRRALDMARRNVPGDGLTFLWRDIRTATDLPRELDFVVMNPPFHDGADEDKGLGQSFLERAASSLRAGGELWLTANVHLPYERTLRELFASAELVAEAEGYKILHCVKGAAKARAEPQRGRRR